MENMKDLLNVGIVIKLLRVALNVILILNWKKFIVNFAKIIIMIMISILKNAI